MAESHKVTHVVCAAFRQRKYVVNFGRGRVPMLSLAFLAKRMRLDVTPSNLAPLFTVAFVDGGVTLVLVVATVLRLLVLFTVKTVRKIGTALGFTRFHWFARHYIHLRLGIIKAAAVGAWLDRNGSRLFRLL
jgi:hypothetical protein